MKNNFFKWLVLLSVGLVAGANGGNTLAFAPILGDVAHDLGIGIPLAQGSFLGIFLFVVAISIVVGGILADRLGVTRTMIIASLAGIVPNLLFPLLGHIFGAVVVLRIFQGFGAGCVFALIPLIAAHWFAPEEKGRVVGIGMTMLNAGMMVGIVGAPMVYQKVGNWRSTMMWMGLVEVLFLLFALYVAANYKQNEPVHTTSSHGKEASGWQTMKSALHNPTTYIGIIMCIFISWLLNALNDLTPQYFALNAPIGVGFGRMKAGQLMLAVQVGTILGGLIGGFVLDKVFKGNPKPVLLLGFLVTAAAVYSILFPSVYNSFLLIPILGLAGVTVAFLNPAAAVFVAQTYPEKIVGKVVGIWLGIGAFGGGMGIISSAICLHATGTYVLTIRLFAAVAILGLILSQVLNRDAKLSLTAARN
ncbi:MAG: rane protein, major facilitator superfamily [Holophagaceae bacterium]|nr:rane protein, major facilitator superfamily [Holophagaceae bacterium]